MILIKFILIVVGFVIFFGLFLLLSILLRFLGIFRKLNRNQNAQGGYSYTNRGANPFGGNDGRDNAATNHQQDNRGPSISGQPTRPKSDYVDNDEEYAQFEEIK